MPTLAGTTGCRLGELVALRPSDVDWSRGSLWVRGAVDIDGSIKVTKRLQHRRQVPVDDETLDVVHHHLDQMAERARLIGVPLAAGPFLFSEAAIV